MGLNKNILDMIPSEGQTALIMVVCEKKGGKLKVHEIHLQNDEDFDRY